MRRRRFLLAAMVAAALTPVTLLATAWGPASGPAAVPSAAGLQAAATASPTWSHPRGRAWLVESSGRDAEHGMMWWIRAVPAPAGLAGFTGDDVVPAPWWSRLRQPPTDEELAAGVVFEAAWGWPVPVLSMSVPTTPMRPTDWAGADDARTVGTPPRRIHVLPTRPLPRGLAIAGAVHWAILLVMLLAMGQLGRALLHLRGRRRRRRGACAGCGHQLPPGKTTDVCPECGRAVIPLAIS